MDFDSPNVFWTHPEVLSTDKPLTDLVGGAGGERLWIGPEIAYFWDGVPDWTNFSNYRKQVDIDPGHYSFDPGASAITLKADMTLASYRDQTTPSFSVRRRIEQAQAPLDVPGAAFTGVTLTTEATFSDTGAGTIDLWQVLQVQPGSQMVVPLRAAEDPLAYGRVGGWQRKPDRITWTFTGTETAKLGLSARAATGRAASLYRDGHGICELIIRDFDVGGDADYVDHPYGMPRTDQVFQAWDGFGFGELEVRSKGVQAAQGRKFSTTNSIWIFAGAEEAVREIAHALLDLAI
jgi:hypothetical protein